MSCCHKCVEESASSIKQDAASAEATAQKYPHIQLHVLKTVNGEWEPCCLSITLAARPVAEKSRCECPSGRANGGRCDEDFSRYGLK
jgi:hypothetical protein